MNQPWFLILLQLQYNPPRRFPVKSLDYKPMIKPFNNWRKWEIGAVFTETEFTDKCFCLVTVEQNQNSPEFHDTLTFIQLTKLINIHFFIECHNLIASREPEQRRYKLFYKMISHWKYKFRNNRHFHWSKLAIWKYQNTTRCIKVQTREKWKLFFGRRGVTTCVNYLL